MNLTVTKKELANALKVVSGAVSRSTTLPILSCVRLLVDKKRFTVSATDLDMSIEAEAEFVKSEKDFGVCVRATVFRNIVSDVTGDEQEIDLDLNGGVLKVITPSGCYRLQALEADEFPKLEAMKVTAKNSFKFGAAQFHALFYAVSSAQSTDDSRYVLNGCDLLLNKELTAVATDGRRLMKMSFTPEESIAEQEVIVPAKAVNQLLRLLPGLPDMPVAGVISKDRAQFKFGTVTFSTKLIDGIFPNWKQVIPKNSKRLIIARAELLASANRLRRVGEHLSLKLTKNNLQLHCQPEKASEDEGTENIVVLNTEKICLKLQVKYLLDALNATLEETVALEFQTNVDPLVLRGTKTDWLAVIMPLRLNRKSVSRRRPPTRTRRSNERSSE